MVRFLKTVAFAAAALVLSGCYESQYLLLDSASAATPLTSGVYTQGSVTRYVSQQSDGSYNFGSTSHSQGSRLLLNRAWNLGDNVYYFAAQPGPGNWHYGLIVVSGSAVYLMEPDCARDAGFASAEGARYVNADGTASCYFGDANQLRRALDSYFRASSWGTPYYRQ